MYDSGVLQVQNRFPPEIISGIKDLAFMISVIIGDKFLETKFSEVSKSLIGIEFVVRLNHENQQAEPNQIQGF